MTNPQVSDILYRVKSLQSKSKPSDEPPKSKAKGYSVSANLRPSWMNKTGRDMRKLMEYEAIYIAGGIASQCIDAYAYYVLSNGFKIEGTSKSVVSDVEEAFDDMDIVTAMECGVKDSCKFGAPFQEVAYGIGSMSSTPVAVVPLPAYQMRSNFDEHGRVMSHTQVVPIDAFKVKEITFDTNEIITYTLFPTSGNPYGVGLIERCLSSIINDDKISAATAAAIMRHGFPKYQIKVGVEGEMVEDGTLRGLDADFRNLEAQNEIATSADVEIINLDKDSLPDIKDIMEVMTTRVCIALGVPEVVMGLGRGATEASSYTEMEAFFKRIHMLQKKIARIYSRQLIDKITGRKGAAWLTFNDANPQDEKEIVDMMFKLMTATQLDPFAVAPRAYIQKRLGIDPEIYLDSEHDFGNETYDELKDEYYQAINDKRQVLPNQNDQFGPMKKNDKNKKGGKDESEESE